MATFTWIPQTASVQEQPKVLSAKFGDGYEQRRPDGINNVQQVWSLFFSRRNAAEANAIRDFLRKHKGSEAFTWYPPDSQTAITVVCKDWSGEAKPGKARTVTAKFEQVFG